MGGLLCTTRVLALAFGILGGRGCSEPSVPSSVSAQAPTPVSVRDAAMLLPLLRPARGGGVVVGIRIPFH